MKHGFLILCHNHYEQVRKLVSLLDNSDSYIFVHIDKKSLFSNEEFFKFCKEVHNAHIIFVDRINVQWGGYSQIESTMRLFKEASKDKYNIDYFHLISGADLLLKKWKDFNDFFETNKGAQFVSFVPEKFQKSFQKRIKYYYFFQEYIGNPRLAIKQKNLRKITLLIIQRVLILSQKIMRIDRRKNNINILFTAGSNWVSINKEFLNYIVSKEHWIEDTFRNTICSDEMFVTTLLSNSNFSKKVLPNHRYIDWRRGNPYIFRNKDYNELMNCDALFARKFDQEVDSQIIDKIYTKISELPK